MLGSRLFWKLFLGFTLVNLLPACLLVRTTWSWQSDQAASLAQRELATAAELLAGPATDWAIDPTEASEASLAELARRAGLTLEITRTADDKSLTTSEKAIDQAPPPNRFHRALKADDRLVGDLWVESSDASLDRTLSQLWADYATYAPAVALLMVAAGWALVAHLVAPVRSLNRVARAMVAGNYGQRAFVANRDELGSLARSFNQMNEELGQRLNELQTSDRRQATVLGGMIEGVVAIDSDQRILFANAAAGKLFDFFPPQVEGRPIIEAVRSHSLHQAASAAITLRTPQRLEIDWGERVLSVQVTPLVGEQAAGAVVVLHDTTELRRLENLRRDFVANVSHELKTPLSTIKANAETLLLGAVDDKKNRERFLKGIDEQSDRLAELIQDMLQLARIESAQQPFEIEPVKIADLVAPCLENHKQKAEAKRIGLRVEPAEGAADALVKADREGLRVILNNLIDNAIKYTPAGEGDQENEVRIAWHPEGNAVTPRLRIEITDTGHGIPEEKLSRVFERFYRIDDARSRHLGGTGLGLSIVKHLTQSFGGTVTVENVPNGGAKFSVILPAA